MATAQLRFTAAGRREQILTVATRLFARQGFQGTTTKQIAEHAGVTEALIFRHFPSKESLYWAVIQAKIRGASPRDRMRERLNAGGTDAEVLAGLAAEILERRSKDQTLSRLLLYSALENHRLSHRFFRNHISGYYDVLAEYIRRRVGEGAFRAVDPLLAARGFLGMVIYHSWVQELFGGKRFQKFSVQQVSKTLVDIWLQGMLQPSKATAGVRHRRSNNGNHRATQEHGSVTQNS
ncbi:MAG TPA: TetR/AcrR family transcriptional regulator [Terriglobales bacterium]|jgi:AcrR family transcriptional regulator|nr:TetR/AcrR family transcriptional regulator [Terriglobales bacterium]